MATRRWIEGTGPKEPVVIVWVGNGGSGDGEVRLGTYCVGGRGRKLRGPPGPGLWQLADGCALHSNGNYWSKSKFGGKACMRF